MTEQERSESGDPIYRYDNVKPQDFIPASGDGENIEAISNHIETHIGKIEIVFHEIISDLVHIDVYWVKPSEAFPFHTLVTSGMSDKPMNVPVGLEDHRYTELCILLPEDWCMPDNAKYEFIEKAFKSENNYWPVRWLKTIARFPHEYNTWVGYGHTIPNGKDATPFADNTKFGCFILLPSLSLGGKFFKLKINDEKVISFYCLYPIYQEEMELKLRKGSDALLNSFEKYDVLDIIDLKRVNTAVRKGFLGLW